MSFPNVQKAWKKDFVYKTVGDLEISLTVWANKEIKGIHPLIVQYHPVRCSRFDMNELTLLKGRIVGQLRPKRAER
jgi:hypothetical protein